MIYIKKLLFIFSFFLYFFISFLLFDIPVTKAAETKITQDFDVRTTTSMTEEAFNEAFKGGVLEGKYQVIIDSAKKYGINAGFMSSIILHESGRGKSDMIKEINNPGGLTCKKTSTAGSTESIGVSWDCVFRGDRKWKKFKNLDDAIKEKADYLDRFYIQNDKVTIYNIQQDYCPDGDGCGKWISGVISAMVELGEGEADGIANPSGDVKHNQSTDDDSVIGSVFFEERAFEKDNFGGSGINTKNESSSTYQDYKFSGWMKFIVNLLRIITMVASILIFGYVSIIWMLILLARTHMAPVHDFLNKISLGTIDPHNDLGKMIKITVIVLIIVSISASGLMPIVFIFIYQTIINIVEYIF